MTVSGWREVLGQKCIAQRYVLGIMGFFAVLNAYTMRVCLSVAIVQMVGNNNSDVPVDPDSCPYPPGEGGGIINGEFDWDVTTVGLILSAFYWGYVITHLPGGILSERWGGKYLLSIGLLCTSVFCILSPLAARAGPGWFILIRVLMGLGEGTTFPAVNALLAQWVPVSERGFLGTLVFAGSQLGTVTGTALSGVLIEAYGWETPFYLFGALSMVWFVVFTLVCYSSPKEHPFITQKELDYLQKELGDTVEQHVAPIPWKKILTSVPLWGLVCAQFGHDWGYVTLVTDLPLYMSDVLHFSVSTNGLVSSLPYLVMWFVSMGSGWFADIILRKNLMSVTNVRKVFTTIASALPAIGLMLASYAGCDAVLVVVLFTVFVGSMGTFYPGFKVNALDLSPNYAGTLMAIVNGIGSFTGIITPYLVGVLTTNHTAIEWRTVFWIVFGVMNVTNLLYVFTASGEVQAWNWGPDPANTTHAESAAAAKQKERERRNSFKRSVLFWKKTNKTEESS